MNILSIDVGIKNLAYCLFEINHMQFTIKKWEVVNLCPSDITCSYMVKNNLCGKKASFIKNNEGFCKTHAKKSRFILPDKTITASVVRKYSIQELNDLAKKYDIDMGNISPVKKQLDAILPILKGKKLDTIKKCSASEMKLVDIGIAIKRELNKQLGTLTIDKILIENQLSPLANRMKTIQGMIAQYFIMNGMNDVDFISATNKLKLFSENNVKKIGYAERKQISIKYTMSMLEVNDINKHWIEFFESHGKKDDLADSFLQGLWYINYNKLIHFPYNIMKCIDA